MSIHPSLAAGKRTRRHRNVLSREERIAKLEEDGRWDESNSVFGLAKVRSIKPSAGKKKTKKEEEAVETPAASAEGAGDAAGATGAAGGAAAE